MSSTILETLGSMAWERAKGELRGMLTTFYPSYIEDKDEKFKMLAKYVNEFIEKVDNLIIFE